MNIEHKVEQLQFDFKKEPSKTTTYEKIVAGLVGTTLIYNVVFLGYTLNKTYNIQEGINEFLKHIW